MQGKENAFDHPAAAKTRHFFRDSRIVLLRLGGRELYRGQRLLETTLGDR
jgi:hypothetical protein